MQELYLLIKQRFSKVTLFLSGQISPQGYQVIREEEKSRCEKQTWILSMMKSKKSLSLQNKIHYYEISYQIMTTISNQFTCKLAAITEETFLNDFIGLYTTFFQSFESKFSFKVKLKSLIRPTNHNIINDFIKYLADFSRDYFQQICFWSQKKRKDEEIEQEKKQQKTKLKKEIVQNNRDSFCLNEVKFEGRKSNDEIQRQVNVKKALFGKLYGVLDLQPFSLFVLSQKSKKNIELIKLRMNEMFRDSKQRNLPIKSLIQEYFTTYFPYDPPSKQKSFDDSSISQPFYVTLIIQKNGFSSLDLNYVEQKCTQKQEKKLQPVNTKKNAVFTSSFNRKTSSAAVQKELVINSLKVLRVSENFHPLSHGTFGRKANHEQRLVRIEKKIKSFSQMQKNQKKQELLIFKDQKSTYNEGLRYYNEELSIESEKLMKEKRRIKEIRKQFTSDSKIKNSQKFLSSEDDMIQWFDKINLMKQVERKKMSGVH